jgi:hypothetical protein
MDQSSEDRNSSVALVVLRGAEVEQQLRILGFPRDSFKLFSEEDRHHCLSLTRSSRYPEKMYVAMQPGLVSRILCNPLAGASDPRPLCAFKALSINVGIGEEEGISTGADFLFEGFY